MKIAALVLLAVASASAQAKPAESAQSQWLTGWQSVVQGNVVWSKDGSYRCFPEGLQCYQPTAAEIAAHKPKKHKNPLGVIGIGDTTPMGPIGVERPCHTVYNGMNSEMVCEPVPTFPPNAGYVCTEKDQKNCTDVACVGRNAGGDGCLKSTLCAAGDQLQCAIDKAYPDEKRETVPCPLHTTCLTMPPCLDPSLGDCEAFLRTSNLPKETLEFVGPLSVSAVSFSGNILSPAIAGWIDVSSQTGRVVKLSDAEYAHLEELRAAVRAEEERVAKAHGVRLEQFGENYDGTPCQHICHAWTSPDHYEFRGAFLLVNLPRSVSMEGRP